MMTPEEKYNNDAMYRSLVQSLEALLHQANFCPSEIREAAMLACVHHEMRQTRSVFVEMPSNVIEAMDRLNDWRKGK